MTSEDALRYLLRKEDSKLLVGSQLCAHQGEYPKDPKHFIICYSLEFHSGKGVKKTRVFCEKHYEGLLLNVVQEKKARIEQEIEKGNEYLLQIQGKNKQEAAKFEETRKQVTVEEDKLRNLINYPSELQDTKKELEKAKNSIKNYYEPRDKEKQHHIDDLKNRLKKKEDTGQNIEYSTYLKDVRAEKQNTIEESPQAIVSNVITHSAKSEKPSEQKSSMPQTVQRITEREKTEKTEKEKITEVVISDPLADKEIKCEIKGWVSIVSECKGKCLKTPFCPFWMDIYVGKIPQDAEIRSVAS
jgi:hypothetical protein